MEKRLNQIILENLSSPAREALSTIWFTADYHHGHPQIIKHCNRPVNKDDHDDWIIEEVHNKYVEKKDRIYMLGDITMARRKEAEIFLGRLKGQKFLVKGNHDRNIHNSPQFAKIANIMDFKFNQFELDIQMVLCHYPMMSWNKSYHGSWSLYGHVHGRLKHPYLGLDVGIDNADIAKYRPINMMEIIKWMLNKEKLIAENKLTN